MRETINLTNRIRWYKYHIGLSMGHSHTDLDVGIYPTHCPKVLRIGSDQSDSKLKWYTFVTCFLFFRSRETHSTKSENIQTVSEKAKNSEIRIKVIKICVFLFDKHFYHFLTLTQYKERESAFPLYNIEHGLVFIAFWFERNLFSECLASIKSDIGGYASIASICINN